MEIFSALLAICAGNSPVTGEFPTQRPVTRSFDVYFDLRPKERLSKQWWGWWFETLSRSLWRHRNGLGDNWYDTYDYKAAADRSCMFTLNDVAMTVTSRYWQIFKFGQAVVIFNHEEILHSAE